MKPSTVNHIQKQLRAFLPIMTAIIDCYKYTLDLNLIKQLVSNAAGDSSNCSNVNDEDRRQDIINLRNALDKLNRYNERNPSLNYICQECIMIIDGNEMSEDDRNGGNPAYVEYDPNKDHDDNPN